MSASGHSAPGRLSAANTGDSTTESYRTALRGASLAFQRTGPQNRQPGAANDGFHAATTLSPSSSLQHSLTGQRSPPRLRSGQVSRNTTGNSHASTSVGIAYSSHHHDPDHGPFTPQRQSHVSQTLTPSHGATLLAPPGKSPATDAKSTSFIAATLAASRSNSPSSRQSQVYTPSQQTPRNRRMNSTEAPGGSAASSSLSLVSSPDESSIPRTTALISMFENKDDGGNMDDNTDPVKKQTPSRQSAQQTTPLAARTTLRPQTPPRATSPVLSSSSVSPSRQASTIAWQTSPGRQAAAEHPSPSARYSAASQVRKHPPAPPPVRSRTVNLRGNTEAMSGKEPAEQRAIKARPITPPPRTISRSQTVIVSPQPKRITSQTLLSKDPPGRQEPVMKSKPVTMPPRPKIQQAPQGQISPGRRRAPLSTKPNMNAVKATSKSFRKSSMVSTSSNDTFVSASSAPSPGPESPRRRFRPPSPSPPRVTRPASAVGAAPRQHWQKPTQPGPRHRASDAALSSLTSAIVAGSLASARATPTISKARTPPTPPPRKATPRLKKTLRQPPTKSDDEGAEQRYKKHRIRSNKKHSHHEGSRKRWRDEITARERKRYEGVWASNRGRLLLPQQQHQQHLHPTDRATTVSDADSIANVVARDIWSRSRLPSDELAEVWDLVDTTGRGALGRTEFVVGMWLIDQRLRGRKIPQKVGESVWSSAKGFEVVVGHPSRSGKKHKRGD